MKRKTKKRVVVWLRDFDKPFWKQESNCEFWRSIYRTKSGAEHIWKFKVKKYYLVEA